MLQAFRTSISWTRTGRRLIHSLPPSSRRVSASRITPIGVAFLSCGIIGGAIYTNQGVIHADSDTNKLRSTRSRTSLSSLLRSYVVYTLCSVPALVDYSPTVLATLTTIPGVKHVAEAIVRSTFFAQFVGGDSAEDTIPLLMRLREDNKGVLLAYSVEVDRNEAERQTEKKAAHSLEPAVYKMNVEETLKCIDVAADFEDRRRTSADSGAGRKTWVAIKLVGYTFIMQSTF